MYEEELDLQHPLFSVHGYDEKKVSTVIFKQHCTCNFYLTGLDYNSVLNHMFILLLRMQNGNVSRDGFTVCMKFHNLVQCIITIIIVVFIIAKMIFENIKLDVNVIITILVPQSQSI